MKKSLECIKCENALNHSWCESGIEILEREGTKVTEKETINIFYPYANITQGKRFEYTSSKSNVKAYGIDIYVPGVDDYYTYTITSAEFIPDEKINDIIDEILE